MALHSQFPNDPHAILGPDIRWFPAHEALREKRADQLMPPLVSILRRKVKEWRDQGYEDATATSKALLTWRFATQHLLPIYKGPWQAILVYHDGRYGNPAAISPKAVPISASSGKGLSTRFVGMDFRYSLESQQIPKISTNNPMLPTQVRIVIIHPHRLVFLFFS